MFLCPISLYLNEYEYPVTCVSHYCLILTVGPHMSTKQAVLRELGRCCSMGMIGPDDIDARTIDFIASYPMPVAMRALQDFFSKDLAKVNNIPNYLKGIVKKCQERAGDNFMRR